MVTRLLVQTLCGPYVVSLSKALPGSPRLQGCQTFSAEVAVEINKKTSQIFLLTLGFYEREEKQKYWQ